MRAHLLVVGAVLAISCGGGTEEVSGTTSAGGAGGRSTSSASSGSTSGATGGSASSGSTTSSTSGATGSTTSSSTSGAASSSTGSSTSSGGMGVTGPSGGKLDTLSFVVVGDTRPPITDDTAGYPTATITKIWQDVAALSPQPAFAVGTGDYMFALTQAAQQLALYNGARAAYSGVMFPAMGNHECSWLGLTTSNCGMGNADGLTANYTTFISTMLAPHGISQPYYTVNIASTGGTWTAKLVFIAANAWDQTQATWLDAEMAKPTTYTFVVRHEGVTANTAPGVTPSEAILASHPWTLKIVGHIHTYQYTQADREVTIGNGGAPLSGAVNYGYVVARQRADGAIAFTSYDFMTNAVVETFAVKADGTPTP